MASDRLTVSELSSSRCMVNWQLYHWPREVMASESCEFFESIFISAAREFSCSDFNTYELFFSYGYSDLLIVLKIISSDDSSDNPPKNVFAIVDGRVVEFVRLKSQGYQVYVKWNNKVTNRRLPLCELYKKNFPFQFPNVQLIMEFQDGAVSPTSKSTTSGERHVLEHLSKLLETRVMADVLFVIKGQCIKAHSSILASASPVFAVMFQENAFKEANTKTVTVEDLEPEVFQDLLRYVYTGVVPFTDTIESLYVAADKYQIDRLKSECESHLHCTLTMDNVVRRLVLAHLYSAANLLEEAARYIIRHKEEVWFRQEWKELNNNYPDLFFIVTQKLVLDT